jgi:hypothetical protein
MRLIADSFETAFRLSENSTFSNVDFSAISGGSLRVDNAGYVVFNSTGNGSFGSTTPLAKLAVQKNYGNTAGSLFLVASSTASNGSTASTALHIAADGRVKIGVGTNTAATAFGHLYVQDDIELDGTADANTGAILCIDNTTGLIGKDNTSTASQACGTGVTSDFRLKENIEPLSASSLERIMELSPRAFDWKVPANHDFATSSTGFVAQELMEVFPELIFELPCRADECLYTAGGPVKGINVNGPEFIAHMVISIQEINSNLQALASTTASSTPAATAFAQSFFEGIFARMTTWLADTGNGIANLFATTITAETVYAKQLCLTDESGETCVTKTQLDALLNGSSAPAYTPPVVPPPSDDSGTTTDDGGGSTEEPPVDETPVEEPPVEEPPAETPPAETPPVEEPTPEPSPEPTPEPAPEPAV